MGIHSWAQQIPQNGSKCLFRLLVTFNAIIPDEDNFTQCGIFFRDVLNKDEKERLVDNIASHICNAQDFLQDRAVRNFGTADKTFGTMLRKRIDFYKKPIPNPKVAAMM